MSNGIPVDYSRKWFVMGAVSMGVFLSTIDGSIVNIALPTLQEEFGAQFSSVQWVVLAYLLVLGTLSLLIGRLGDMIGKKRIYTTGFVVFTAGSLASATSQSVGILIGWRIMQAVGAAMVLSLGIAILTEAFPPTERGRALGLIGTTVSVGIVVGPTLGGLILSASTWRWIFLVNVPVGIIGTITSLRYIPNTIPGGKQRFDFAGAGLFALAITSFMLGVTLGGSRGFGSGLVLSLLTMAAVLAITFVMWERKVDQPIIDLAIFENKLFSINIITGLLAFVCVSGVFFISPFYLERTLGLESRQIGLLLAASPILLAIFAPASGLMSDKIGARPITIAGLIVLLFGYWSFRRLGVNTTPTGFVLALAPIGVGMGLFQSPNNSIIMGSVRPERLGIASGLLNLTRILGQITGIGVLTTFWSIRADAAGGQNDPAGIVTGLHDTMLVAIALIGFGFSLAVWGYLAERRQQTEGATV